MEPKDYFGRPINVGDLVAVVPNHLMGFNIPETTPTISYATNVRVMGFTDIARRAYLMFDTCTRVTMTEDGPVETEYRSHKEWYDDLPCDLVYVM